MRSRDAENWKSQESRSMPATGVGTSKSERTEPVAAKRQELPSRQIERDVEKVRLVLDYPKTNHAAYIAAVEALDRLARKAHEADRLIAQHELVALEDRATGGGRWHG